MVDSGRPPTMLSAGPPHQDVRGHGRSRTVSDHVVRQHGASEPAVDHGIRLHGAFDPWARHVGGHHGAQEVEKRHADNMARPPVARAMFPVIMDQRHRFHSPEIGATDA